MIFFDSETTGLPKSDATSLVHQPFITEIYAVRVDENYQMVAELDTLIRPPIPIPGFITKISGIDDTLLNESQAPTFVQVYPRLIDLFLGEREVIAHNCTFDMTLIFCELARLGRQFQFPWPHIWTCTVEKSKHIQGRRLTLQQLCELAGFQHRDAHRAKPDVVALMKCHEWMREKGLV